MKNRLFQLLKRHSVVNIVATISVLMGAIAFWLNWAIWQGGMPGYHILLWPGNASLIYVWQPIFSEEINFLPKLILLLSGQFLLTALATWSILNVTRAIIRKSQ